MNAFDFIVTIALGSTLAAVIVTEVKLEIPGKSTLLADIFCHYLLHSN